MASSEITTFQDRLGVVITDLGFAGQTIGAHFGKSTSVTVTVPDGYEILAHVACWSTGMIGILAGFDNYAGKSKTVNVYINNTTDASVTTINGFKVHILTVISKV